MKASKFDYPLMILTVLLVSFGVLMVFSSSYYVGIDKMQSRTHFFVSDLKWVIIGFASMIFASFVPYKVYRKAAIPVFIVSMFLLVYVLVNGTVINNAQRWIFISNQGFMPAEIAKIGTIFFFAFALERNHHILHRPGVVAVYLSIILINVYLIMKQPNMSTAVIIAGVLAIMLFVAGLRWAYTIAATVFATIGGWVLVAKADYRLERWTSFLDPFAYKTDESWQVVQSLYALGTGGLRGVGLSMSTQNKLYIPEPQNDFILATIGEEFGLMGTVLLLLVFFLMLYRCIKIAMHAPDMFSLLLATGITSMYALQIIMNYAVATSSMPVTGVTLPFISYGGTSVVIMLGAMGILLNISKHTQDHKESL